MMCYFGALFFAMFIFSSCNDHLVVWANDDICVDVGVNESLDVEETFVWFYRTTYIFCVPLCCWGKLWTL